MQLIQFPAARTNKVKALDHCSPCLLCPQCLLHWNTDVTNKQNILRLYPTPAPASCRREVGENISIPKVINSKPSPCRQETLRGLHLPARRGIISLEHVQLIILMGSILLFEIRMVCSSWGWYLLTEGPWCPRSCLTCDRAVPHLDPCPALSCSS